jgi:hypothetical protein
MKPVYQREKTDCVRACVASVLELPYEAVPAFDPYKLNEELPAYLRGLGLGAVNMQVFEELPPYVPAGYTLGGIKPRQLDPIGHCVVCWHGYIVFDPYTGPVDGKKRPDEYTFIYPLVASRVVPDWYREAAERESLLK